MDYKKTEDFLRTHWPALLIAAVLVSPTVWGAAYLHFSERITVLELQQLALKEKVETLEELTKRTRERALEEDSIEFSTSELFCPSSNLQPEGP